MSASDDVRKVHLSDATHVRVGRVGLVRRAVVVVAAPAEAVSPAPRTVPPPRVTPLLDPAIAVLTQRMLELMDARDNQWLDGTSS